MAQYDLAKTEYALKAVLSDGTSIDLAGVAENIAWEENKSELAVRLNLTLRDVPCDGKRLAELLPLCTQFYVYSDWGQGPKEVFRGTEWTWQNSDTNGDQIILTCYDLLYYLQKSTDNKYYAKGKTTKQIISDILQSWNVTMGTYSGPDVSHEKTLYKNKAVSAMLTETLDKAEELGGGKAVLLAEAGKVSVYREAYNSEIYAFTADTNLVSVQDTYSMTELVTRVQIVGKEDSQGRPIVKDTVNGATEYGILQTIQSIGSGTLAEAKKAAEKIIKDQGKPKRTIILQAPDFPPIRKGYRIYAKTDRLDGYFVVESVSHNATARMMQMEVRAA